MKNLIFLIKKNFFNLNIQVYYISINSILLQVQKPSVPKLILEFYDFFYFITDIFLFISLVTILMYNMFFKNSSKKNLLFILLTNINIYIFLFFVLFIINVISNIYVHYTLNFTTSNYTFLSRLFIIILFLIFFILLKYYNIISKSLKQFEFLFLIGCSALSLLLLLKSANFISFIILLEIYSIISYILLVHKTFSLFSTEGGLKYFIIGSLSTGIAILGLFCLYTGIASYNYNQISSLTNSYSPFWQPEDMLPEFFETKARKNPFLFELCKLLNEFAHMNYKNALKTLEHWEPILSDTEKKLLEWNKQLQEYIYRRPSKTLHYYFPGNDIARLLPNKNYVSDHVQKAIEDTIITKQDVILLKKNKSFLELIDVVLNDSANENVAYVRIKELENLRNNKFLLYLFVKEFLFFQWENWEQFCTWMDSNPSQVSSLDLEQNPELFYKQMDLLKDGKIKEFKLNQEACENKFLIEFQNYWHTTVKTPWQALNIRKFPHENELWRTLEELVRVEYKKMNDFYQRYKFNIEQNGFIGQEKQWLNDMVNNYTAYVKKLKPSISDYNLQLEINKAIKTREIIKYHPNYTDDIMNLNRITNADKFLNKHYLIVKDNIIMDKHSIEKSLIKEYSKALVQVTMNKEYIIIIQNALNYQMLGLTFIFISLWLKLGIAPFHMWSFDAYEGTDTWVMAFLNIISKCVIFFFLIILIDYFNLDNFKEVSLIAFWCVFFSSIVGAIGGLIQYSVKRMLIYSGLSNSAFLMSFFIINTSENEHAFFFYIVIYLSVMLGIFLCIFWLRDRCTCFLIKNYYNFINLLITHKHFIYYLSVFFFCLIGLPPLIFFFGKFYLLYSLYRYQIYIILLALLFLTCINITYYLRIIKIVSLMKNDNCIFLFDMSRRDAIIFSIISLLIIIFIFIPTPLFVLLFKIIFK